MLRVDHGADIGRVGLKQRRFTGHFYGFSILANSQLDICGGDLVKLKFDRRLNRGPEAGRAYAHLITPDRKMGKAVVSLSVRFRLPHRSSIEVGCHHFSVCNRVVCRVSHRAVDRCGY